MESFSEYKKIQESNLNQSKSIESAILCPEVAEAFDDFKELTSSLFWAIGGGLAVSSWLKSRMTTDIDIFIFSENDVQKFENILQSKFKKNRKHSFEHKKTGVEIEILTPEFLNIPKDLVKLAIENSREDHIITPKYLTLLKLYRAINTKNPGAYQDREDIKNLIKYYGFLDLSKENISKEMISLYRDLNNEIL